MSLVKWLVALAVVCGPVGWVTGAVLAPVLGWWITAPLCMVEGFVIGTLMRWWYDLSRGRE